MKSEISKFKIISEICEIFEISHISVSFEIILFLKFKTLARGTVVVYNENILLGGAVERASVERDITMLCACPISRPGQVKKVRQLEDRFAGFAREKYFRYAAAMPMQACCFFYLYFSLPKVILTLDCGDQNSICPSQQKDRHSHVQKERRKIQRNWSHRFQQPNSHQTLTPCGLLQAHQTNNILPNARTGRSFAHHQCIGRVNPQHRVHLHV